MLAPARRQDAILPLLPARPARFWPSPLSGMLGRGRRFSSSRAFWLMLYCTVALACRTSGASPVTVTSNLGVADAEEQVDGKEPFGHSKAPLPNGIIAERAVTY